MTRASDRVLCELAMQSAFKHLRRADPIMSDLVKRFPKCNLAEREFLPFRSLVVAIISQQLSAKAADTIELRVKKLLRNNFTPRAFLKVSVDQLRSVGLSRAKASYILGIAARVVDGSLDFKSLNCLDDEEVITKLMEIPGIGRWTAEMFLIFSLRRPDVLSLTDAGLNRAARLLYGASEAGEILQSVSRAWSPYRSVASWYLWRYLDERQ